MVLGSVALLCMVAHQDHTFEIEVSTEHEPNQTLLLGLSNIGMAGLTAVDHLVRHHDAHQIGHISPEELPAMTPFANGDPRHHTRLYDIPDAELTVLVNELVIPVVAARSFTTELLNWATGYGIEEAVILNGIPYPHAPDQHDVFYVATPAYRDHYVAETEIPPLGGGFLDGVAGELLTRGLDDSFPPVGVFITPSHPPGPDAQAAIRLLETLESVHEVSTDTDALEQLSTELHQYYAELADRVTALDDAEQPISNREYPENRMFY